MAGRLPHPLPYQGSKRLLAKLIAPHIPCDIDTWFEPFAGSAAMSLWAARERQPKRIVIADSLEPICDLWRAIIAAPARVADRYAELWHGHAHAPEHFLAVRARFNASRDPIDLLYLTARCVKNAVRFNRKGEFTQSADRRRLGMRPDRMRAAIDGAAMLLQGRTEIRAGDWLATTADAKPGDFLYLDPPYAGTSTGRDLRYAEQMGRDRLIDGLRALVTRDVRFALSYDGMTGAKTHAAPLPEDLALTRLLLAAGKSTQATLNGRSEQTVESLYLYPSHAIARGHTSSK